MSYADPGELAKVRQERDELRALFDLQQKRMETATALWRAEDPANRAMTLPDLGDLLKWLIDRGVEARERLGRIEDWHSRETGPAGMTGSYCVECGALWPCNTRRMADGTFDPHQEVL